MSKENSSSMYFPAMLRSRRFRAATAIMNMMIPRVLQRTLVARSPAVAAVDRVDSCDSVSVLFKTFLEYSHRHWASLVASHAFIVGAGYQGGARVSLGPASKRSGAFQHD